MFEEMLPAQKLMASVFWARKGRPSGGIYAARDHSNIRSVLKNTFPSTPHFIYCGK
jgi:hypothetical protein